MQRLTYITRSLRATSSYQLTETFSKRRRWVFKDSKSKEFLHSPISEEKRTEIVKVLSYNILADNNIRQYLFKGRKLSDISFKKRRERLLTEISVSKADIICLQEVEDIHSSSIASFFKAQNYESFFKRKADPSKADGCMILWNSERFRLVKKCWGSLGVEAGINYFTTDLSTVSKEEVLKDLRKERDMRLRNGHPLFVQRRAPQSFNNRFIDFATEMYYHSLVIFTLLEDRKSKKVSLVATTHLLFNSKRGHLKLSQLVIIFKAIQAFRKEFDIENVFLCGDFNFVPNSALYHFVSNHEFDVRALLEEYSNQKLLEKNNYKTMQNIINIADMKYSFNKGPYTLEGFTQHNEKGLDYSVFHNLDFLESLVSLQLDFFENSQGDTELIYYNDIDRPELTRIYQNIGSSLSRVEKSSQKRRALTLELNKLAFSVNLRSSYSEVNQPKSGPESIFNRDCKVTQFGDHIKVPVDYIWFSRDSSLQPLAVLEVPDEEVLEKKVKRGLPYKEFASDHFSVSSIFSL